jgi:arylsulfatase A-like enzyme
MLLAPALPLVLGAGRTAAASEAAPRPRNLVLVSIDTLRPDRLGCYGHPRATSPAIDAIAEAGVLFEDAAATSPWTKPSHASIFTGRHPGRHGAVSSTGLRVGALHPV